MAGKRQPITPPADTRRNQLALGFDAPPPRYGREDFLVSGANETALSIVAAFAQSDDPAIAIAGPPASGKTHLAHVLAAETHATLASAKASLGDDDAPGLLIVDDVETIADPSALLLLLERRRERRLKLALAGQGEPRDWARGLKDLETRLSAMLRADLFEPDEALMRAVMAKAFADRGLRVAETVIDYAVPRLPRTFAAVRGFVDRAEGELLATASGISVAQARKVLGDLSEAPSGA